MNNFDQSSSCVNLELDMSYDSDLSQMRFDESFHVLQYNDRSQSAILVFNQYGNFDVSCFYLNDLDNFNIEALTVKQIFKAFYNTVYSSNIDHDLKCFDLEGIKDLLLNLDVKNLRDIDKRELLEEIETHIYCDSDFNDFLISTFDKNYIELESIGYNQGDHSYVIIPKIVIDSYQDQTVEQIENLLKGEIDHLIWDQPIYARLTINDSVDQFDFMEFTDNLYDYDRDQFLAIAEKEITHEKKDIIIKWLEENLPDQPSYDY